MCERWCLQLERKSCKKEQRKMFSFTCIILNIDKTQSCHYRGVCLDGCRILRLGYRWGLWSMGMEGCYKYAYHSLGAGCERKWLLCLDLNDGWSPQWNSLTISKRSQGDGHSMWPEIRFYHFVEAVIAFPRVLFPSLALRATSHFSLHKAKLGLVSNISRRGKHQAGHQPCLLMSNFAYRGSYGSKPV